MTRQTWRDYFLPIARGILEKNRDATEKELRWIFIREYPLTVRKPYQYRKWRKVVKQVIKEMKR